ncbi:hypothetical protein BgiBS90_015714 [Biomphalaria glabrata]|nr:hypothetical protein BgiBS90_015714 [Biomphalaria glabrata]
MGVFQKFKEAEGPQVWGRKDTVLDESREQKNGRSLALGTGGTGSGVKQQWPHTAWTSGVICPDEEYI